jgi:eukaryotic-like serine/threonine-protein kinase
MSLQIGQQLGSYEITSLIGKGGMGEVYRARDSKLKRDVAIKVLPETFSQEADRVSRFQREAEVLASLNHTNIAGIHDLHETDGFRFLVMELVEGETLAERIKRGPIPVDESLGIAKQICEALEAAHEKGIIHRDLKPANVKITPDGKVKVLDFGLAKAFANEPANTALSNSPTLSMAATNAGVILGTAAYMAPEQAKGKEVDRRTDIFAFGVVLYEMLTGRQAFEGEDLGDILGAVLKSEPDWNRLPASVPGRIRELLRLCLQKDAKKRRQTATDVRIDIEQALAEPAAMPAATAARGGRLAWIASLAVAAVLIVAMAIPTVRHLREAPAIAPEMRFEVQTAPQGDNWIALSPDGQLLVFGGLAGGKWQLWIRPLDSVTARPLGGTEGAAYPFWSPDSRSLGFFSDGKLKRIDIGGGPVQTLVSAPEPRGGSWGKDGTIIFAPVISGPLYRIPAIGGEPAEVTHLEPGQNNHRFPSFLPDGRNFLYLEPRNDKSPPALYVNALNSASAKRLIDADSMAVYGPPGFLFFRRQQTLLAQRFDLEKLEMTGDPFPVAEGVLASANAGSLTVSATVTGTVAYRTGTAVRRRLVWFDRSGKEIGAISAPNSSLFNPQLPELSPDGTRVAIQNTVNGNVDIWFAEISRGVTTRFTTDTGYDQWPLWSPDGSRVVFSSDRKGNFDLYAASSNGTGMEEPLLENPGTTAATSWSSDNRFILYSQQDSKTGFDIWALPLSGDRKAFPVANRNFDELGGQFSKDMRWIAYQSNESGRFEIFVQPFPGPGGKLQISTSGGTAPRWRDDGKELFYVSPEGTLMSVPIAVSSGGKTIEPGTSVPLISGRIEIGAYTGADKPHYAVTADGQRFLLVVPGEDTPPPITVILNWRPPAR